MRKPAFCICENKDADQLRGNREADQLLCFRYIDSTIPLLPIRNFKPLAILCDCTARFVSDLVGDHEDRLSHNEANIIEMRSLTQITRVDFPILINDCVSPLYFFFFGPDAVARSVSCPLRKQRSRDRSTCPAHSFVEK